MKNLIKRISFISTALVLLVMVTICGIHNYNDLYKVRAGAVEKFTNLYNEQNELDTALNSFEQLRPGEKIYCNATSSEEFSPDSVMIVLDEKESNAKGLSDAKAKQIFKNFEFDNITDLTSYPDNPELLEYYSDHTFRQILKVQLKQKSKQNVIDVIDKLEQVDGITYAGPNYSFSLPYEEPEQMPEYETNIINVNTTSPNDPKFNELWGLTGENGIKANHAWSVTAGSENIRVGIIDTGIADHEDLNGHLTDGWDFFNNNGNTTDDTKGHGTHVAGTIGAIADNGIGISGVAQNVTLVPLQAANENNKFWSYTVADSIAYATRLWGTSKQISILNYSVGGFGITVDLLATINQFPGLFVWAAGNETQNVDGFSEINRFGLNNLISVGSIDSSGNRSSFSNYGNGVDIYAPGGGILSTVPGNKYEVYNGTSMAAPHVSGVAALLWSFAPGATASEIKKAIVNGSVATTLDTPAGKQTVRRLCAISAIAFADNAPEPVKLKSHGKSDYTWSIEITNKNSEMVTITYNERMCHEGDAKTFYNLNHLRSFKLPYNGSRIVGIRENGTAGWITVSVDYELKTGDTVRRIIYTDGLSDNGFNEPKFTTIIGPAMGNPDAVPNYLTFELTARYGLLPYEWDVKIKNSNPFSVSVTYNYKMCYLDDARYFRNLSHLADVTVPANGEAIVRIGGNASADYITAAINYTVDGTRYRRVSCANGLTRYEENNQVKFKTNSIQNHEIIIATSYPEVSYKPLYVTFNPTARDGFIWHNWQVDIMNPNPFAVQVSYNSKLCFEGDAVNFVNLNHIVTITIPGNGKRNVRIEANGAAGWIAICMNFSYNGDEYRRVSYADGINVNATNTIKYNEIRFT